MNNTEIACEKTVGRLTIRLDARRLGKDLLVVISGGASHIGAVGAGNVCTGFASSSVITMPGHRDDRIAKDASERLSKSLDCNCVVVAGVHFDHITRQEIEDVLTLTNALLSDLEEKLRTAE
jgi:hypothetical protein